MGETQLVFSMLPELLRAWARGAALDGILQVQVNGNLEDLGLPRWQAIKDKKEPPKAQVRYAFLERRDYLSNLAANLQSSSSDTFATKDPEGKTLNIGEIGQFLTSASNEARAAFHIDVKRASGMVAIVCSVPCDESIRKYIAQHKDPPPPKGSVDGVLQLQRTSGFPKAFPSLLGFQSFPGDLNFPVVDLHRDVPA